MISIIVPVYNTEKYLDKCIRSIVGQTFEDLEVIFINDGSTDCSLEILEKYQALDDRIHIFSKKNEGQGVARNMGIEQAHGEYIMFVDSDDWLAEDCVETLYHSLQTNCTKVAMGYFAKTVLDKEEIFKVMEADEKFDDLLDVHTDKKLLFGVRAFPFAKLYKRSLFVENGVCFPAHRFEDACTIPLIYALAGRIAYEKKVVYYYRNREGSTVNSVQFIYDRINSMRSLKEGFMRFGLYEEYEEEIREYLVERSKLNRRKVQELTSRINADYAKAQMNYDVQECGIIYDKKSNVKAYLYGSYNLMIGVKIYLQIKNKDSVPNYYSFQNLISGTCQKNGWLNTIEKLPDNTFQADMLMKDFEKAFMRLHPGRFKNVDYLFIDLLEERYDTGCYDGEYFTVSDGLRAIEKELNVDYTVIYSFSEEWKEIWYGQCDIFIERLKSYLPEEKIVLIKMMLAEKYEDEGKTYYFREIENIRRINENLEECYRYFAEKCPNAIVIEVADMDSYYTDAAFRHGCYPWHLNNEAYHEIAARIRCKIEGNRC